ncbi:MAG TPA: lytic murein transglycosylase [Malonomonas sp.]
MNSAMRQLSVRHIISILLLGLCLVSIRPQLTQAQDSQVELSSWMDALQQDALAAGIRQETLDRALSSVQLLDWIIKADRNQPEFKKSLDSYLAGVLSDERISRGRQLLAENDKLLGKIALRYKVQPRFIVALWGIETYYGKHTGKVPIIDALVTLAYDGRRSAYFRTELLNALKIIDAGHINYEQMLGSWAGAMGQVQFMPSSFLRYAVDGNADGRIDLWKTPEDYLSSAANYLAQMGWHGNQTWGREVIPLARVDGKLIGLNKTAPLRHWQEAGVRLVDGADLPKSRMRASVLQPEGPAGRTFLVYENYQALLKWNRAHSFAIAVGMLADRLRVE